LTVDAIIHDLPVQIQYIYGIKATLADDVSFTITHDGPQPGVCVVNFVKIGITANDNGALIKQLKADGNPLSISKYLDHKERQRTIETGSSRFYNLFYGFGSAASDLEILFCVPLYYRKDRSKLESDFRSKCGWSVDEDWVKSFALKKRSLVGKQEWVVCGSDVVEKLRAIRTMHDFYLLDHADMITTKVLEGAQLRIETKNKELLFQRRQPTVFV